MIIGIVKELPSENRVAILPEAVSALIALNCDVIIEKEAGLNAFATDNQYENSGAKVVSKKDVYEKSDLILKVNVPTEDEIKNLKPEQVVVGALNPLTNKTVVSLLKSNNITSFSLDAIPRISRAQAMDVLSSMATVAGYRAVLEAAFNLPTFFPMFMSAAGTIKPAKVLILGAGVAGLQAIASARKLGAVVEAFDVRSAVKEEVQSLGASFVEVEGAIDDASAGGYAVEQSKEFKEKQAELIQQHALKSDVVICTAQIPGRKAPLLITKGTVGNMKPGSVIIDLAASTGGNCELTENSRTVVVNGVKVIGNSDYPSGMSVDASRMYSKNLINFIKLIIDKEGKINLNFEDEIVKGACITHDKQIINDRVKSLFE